ncbi:hypothetical protein [Clostridium sp.]|uniref:hypothetical protein n=1 Tax=Clostridium sp. TaxID=1506 RepID=UPI001A556532|nr:hypothetical protein [Clostridium sp.]MBK5235827.1 hypothetical protein [Clostridium sp.]
MIDKQNRFMISINLKSNVLDYSFEIENIEDRFDIHKSNEYIQYILNQESMDSITISDNEIKIDFTTKESVLENRDIINDIYEQMILKNPKCKISSGDFDINLIFNTGEDLFLDKFKTYYNTNTDLKITFRGYTFYSTIYDYPVILAVDPYLINTSSYSAKILFRIKTKSLKTLNTKLDKMIKHIYNNLEIVLTRYIKEKGDVPSEQSSMDK